MNKELPKFQTLLPGEEISATYKDKTTSIFSDPREIVALKSDMLKEGLRRQDSVRGTLFVTNKSIIYETFNGNVSNRYTYGLIEEITGTYGKGRWPAWKTKDIYGSLNLVFFGGRKVVIRVGKGSSIARAINSRVSKGEFDRLGDSEIISVCNRCDKKWFMNPTELDEFEKGKVAVNVTGADAAQVGLVHLYFGVAAAQRLSIDKGIRYEGETTRNEERWARLEAKFVCPDCGSSDIVRNISKKGEKINNSNKKIVTKIRKNNIDDKLTKLKELKELHDAEAIDDEEFKQMKKEILGK